MKRAREATYRERFRQGAYVATFVLTPAWQRVLIDGGYLLESDLDLEDWRERKHRLDVALARFLFASKPDC